MIKPKQLLVYNKIDIGGISTPSPLSYSVPATSVSCKTEEGLETLESILSSVARQVLENASSTTGSDSDYGFGAGSALFSDDICIISRERHRHHIINCVDHLDRFLLQKLPMDAAAEELR